LFLRNEKKSFPPFKLAVACTIIISSMQHIFNFYNKDIKTTKRKREQKVLVERAFELKFQQLGGGHCVE
jgi:hypothetical protein